MAMPALGVRPKALAFINQLGARLPTLSYPPPTPSPSLIGYKIIKITKNTGIPGIPTEKKL